MTDINELIGPEPIPVPAPKFPTPWHAWGNGVYPKNGSAIAIVKVGELRGLEHEDATALAAFIAEAVNEKITRDQATPPAPAYHYAKTATALYRQGLDGRYDVWNRRAGQWAESIYRTAEDIEECWSEPLASITPADLPLAARPA